MKAFISNSLRLFLLVRTFFISGGVVKDVNAQSRGGAGTTSISSNTVTVFNTSASSENKFHAIH